MRRLAPLVLPALLVGVLTLAGCGGDEDLTVAVATDVRGAAIDAAADAPPERTTEPGTDEGAAAVAVQEPEIAQPEEQPPAAVPDGSAQEADMLLGDVPTANDEIKPPALDAPSTEPTTEPGPESGAEPGEDVGGEPLDIPIPDADDWQIEPPKPPVLIDGEWNTSFDYLGSFDVGLDALSADNPLAQHTPKMPLPEKVEGAPEPEKGIPDEVRAMDGKKVRIEGYMIPLKFEDGAVKTFFLSRYMMGCCFGVLPKANEVIEVQMVGEKGAYYDAYMPFVVVGTFEIVEGGTSPEFLQSVFRMKADACDYAEDW